jgi:NAD(P)-dependent dehydrogenase (short-subunit alcohol dehydrogenase family)
MWNTMTLLSSTRSRCPTQGPFWWGTVARLCRQSSVICRADGHQTAAHQAALRWEAMSRVVLITGGSSGIGRATARQAAQQGDHVVLFARGLGPLEETAQECRDLGAASARAVSVDVTDAIAVRAAVEEASHDLGPIDAVVHSAGVIAYGKFEDVPAEVFDAVIRTNVLGSANVSRAVLPQMRERNSGVVVLLGSLSGHVAAPFMSSYTMSKWAVRALARELQIENRDRPGVHVSLVAPAGVDTPIYLQAANYFGRVGRPPPPVSSPERVAATALALVDRPRPRVQIGAINRVITTGFGLLPWLYDAIVTPVFTTAATDRRHRVEVSAGNVLGSVPESNRLHGEQGKPIVSIVGSIWAALRSRLERSGDGGQGS